MLTVFWVIVAFTGGYWAHKVRWHAKLQDEAEKVFEEWKEKQKSDG